MTENDKTIKTNTNLKVSNQERRKAANHHDALTSACKYYVTLMEGLPANDLRRWDVYWYASEMARCRNRIRRALNNLDELEGLPGATPAERTGE